MPDTWEYPWFAAWDLAFHCVAMARTDPEFAKQQVTLLGREWFMSPGGQLPAYEFNFSDANPPVHAWAAWRVYQLGAEGGFGRDVQFLEAAFQKCLVNFTWWVNREDVDGRNLFAGGFLGLDNVGLFDRSKPIAGIGQLEQADATAWMAFYCTTMLAIALELACDDPAYADMASKFFEHFVAIVQATNEIGDAGLWDEQDGFYYDHARVDGRVIPLRIRSAVGLIPIFAAESLDDTQLRRLPYFEQRMKWFLTNKPGLAQNIAVMRHGDSERRLLAIPSRERLERVLRYMLDENEFLSPHGIRSLSKVYRDNPYVLDFGGERHEIRYAPGESDTGLFGGNSNWRGPVWMPLNYLLIEALKRHHHFYGDTFRVECPTGSGRGSTLLEGEAQELRTTDREPLPAGCRGPRAHVLATAEYIRRIRTIGIWCCSTNTSTGTPVAAWALATRPAGPPSRLTCSSGWRRPEPGTRSRRRDAPDKRRLSLTRRSLLQPRRRQIDRIGRDPGRIGGRGRQSRRRRCVLRPASAGSHVR